VDSGNPTDVAAALGRLGDVLMVDGRFEEASAAFQAALDNGHLSDPTRVQASLAMSSSISMASPTADSEQAIRSALAAAAPELRTSYLVNPALLVMLKGELDEAEALCREVIELEGDSGGTGWEGLGSVYMTAGRVDDAIAAYQTAIEKGALRR
jgi:tetratricopeptide (TPR) repeat protein